MASAIGKKARKQHGGNRFALKRDMAGKRFDKKFAAGKISPEAYQAAKAAHRARLR